MDDIEALGAHIHAQLVPPPPTFVESQLAKALARITDLETALAEHANRIDACEMQIEGLENLSRRLEMEDGYGV